METKTYLVTRADTNNEWNQCEFGIIPIDDKFIKWLETISDATKFMCKTLADAKHIDQYDFQNIKLRNLDLNFFANADEIFLADEHDFMIVDLSDREIEGFTALDRGVSSDYILFDAVGFIQWTAYGKNEGEEYWSMELRLANIIKQYTTFKNQITQ